MCCESKTKTETTSTVPGYIEDASKLATQKATDLANKDVTMPKLDIAGFSADQQSAFQKVRDLASGPAIGTERVVDEDGRLGKISDYMNPWLNPAYAEIQKAEDANRKRIGAGAQSAGAYGDARHGILEVGNMEAAQEARQKAAFESFDKAMAARQVDLDRFTEVDKTNFSNALQAIEALLTTGGMQQGLEQAENQAVFDQFMAQYGHDFDVIAALASTISGLPYTKTQTTTGTEADNSILQTLGGVAGKVASSAPVAGAIASFI